MSRGTVCAEGILQQAPSYPKFVPLQLLPPLPQGYLGQASLSAKVMT